MTERLIPFDLEAAKADPSRVREHDTSEPVPSDVLFGKDGSVHLQLNRVWCMYDTDDYHYLRLTAPAPKRVEVRAALWSDGAVYPYRGEFDEVQAYTGFVRWLTNWHIEDGKVFVEVE